MSYTKTTWQDGDVISAERLNKLENGVANASPMVIINSTYNNDKVVLDKTWQEIYDIVNNKIPVYIYYNVNNSDDYYEVAMEEVKRVYFSNGEYIVSSNNSDYQASSSSSYPAQMGMA